MFIARDELFIWSKRSEELRYEQDGKGTIYAISEMFK